MARFWVIFSLLGWALLLAEDSVVASDPQPSPQASQIPKVTEVPQIPQIPHGSQAPRAWLGLEISRPDEAITVHLPALPQGVGFMIRSISPGGPAEIAGLRNYDVLWKMGDQMLINEGQLAVLLRLAKPGDEISLSGFRAGRPIEVKLKLAEAPATPESFPSDLVDSAVLPGGDSGVPMRVFNISEKIASYETDDGRVQIQRDGEIFRVKIVGPKEEMIFDGALPANGSLDSIPQVWKRRVHALLRGLTYALDGGMVPSRQPRPRVVPTATVKP